MKLFPGNVFDSADNKETKVFCIAGFNIQLVLPRQKKKFLFSKTFQNFISPALKKPDTTIHICYGKIPKVKLLKENFIAGVNKWWSLYQVEGNKVFLLSPVKRKKRSFSIAYKKTLHINGQSSIIKFKRAHDFKSISAILPLPYRIAVFKADFKEGTIYVDNSDSSALPNPLEYPLLDLLLAELLFLKGGIKLHGCGVVDKGQCYLFLGLPGKGKSTMARLWQKEAVVLNDDRIPVKRAGDSFLAFAMPGYTTSSKNTARGFPISKIFFLQHGSKNRISRENGFGALSMLLNCSPVVTWDNLILKQTVTFFTQIVKKVPCYSLYFVPDKRVLDLIRKI